MNRQAPLQSRGRIVRLVTLPYLWAIFGWFQFALYIFATKYVEVAIAAAIYELWLIAMVVVLAKTSPKRTTDNPASRRVRALDHRKLLLIGAAFIGLCLVILGQSDTSISSVRSFLGAQSIGILLALTAAGAAAALGVVGFVSGDRLYNHYHTRVGATQTLKQDSTSMQRSFISDQASELQKLWFIMLMLSCSAILAIPAHFLIGIIDQSTSLSIAPLAFVGAIALGAISVTGSLLWRLANVVTSDLAINAITYVTPVIGLGLLALIGISLPRADLFWMGALLVFAINLLMHVSPDEEGEYEHYGIRRPRGSRLGFTSLIVALWFFGSAIYLRDEIFSSAFLWHTSDYWALVALSATVFALILGFRVARLTSRLNSEDEGMIDLFRRSEQLVREGILPPSALQKLRAFDTATPKQHPNAYDAVRNALVEATLDRRTRAIETSSPTTDRAIDVELYDLQMRLDKLAHSKQQGRDFAELISICLVALMTVLLGLFARPGDLMPLGGQWSGFLTELFATIFVSIVAFLSFNLLDMRREREVPILAAVPDRTSQYSLFFRHKRDIAIAQTISVVIVLAMVVLFAVLLHGKWL